MVTLASACTFNDDSWTNRCPFVECYLDSQCAYGSCNYKFDDGFCEPPSWLIAIMVIAGVLILASFILCLVCCCRRRRLKNELHVYNHLVDANGKPITVVAANGAPVNQYAGQ